MDDLATNNHVTSLAAWLTRSPSSRAGWEKDETSPRFLFGRGEGFFLVPEIRATQTCASPAPLVDCSKVFKSA